MNPTNETLRFRTDFDVPITDNPIEQDVRMIKAKMEISGCFRISKPAVTSPACRDRFHPRENTASAPSKLSLSPRSREGPTENEVG